jgi:16S rRNA (cytidine1402-2'-O)-methyltransferase
MSQKSYNNSPTVYLIPTPIGNVDDITIRAIKILNEVEVIFSEDTRETLKLLTHLELKKKLIANHMHNEEKNKEKVLYYLTSGKSVGIVSDRGTPVISDPGYELTKYVIEQGYNVVGLPGPTALIPALIVSGLSPLPFCFIGFLNSKEGKRKKELEKYKNYDMTLVFYEAPHRIIKTVQNIIEVLGNRKISISREISKKFEEVYRGYAKDVINEIIGIKGEIVVVVEGNTSVNDYYNLTVIEHINLYIKEGYESKEAIKKVAKDRNLNKSEVYSQYHNIKSRR